MRTVGGYVDNDTNSAYVIYERPLIAISNRSDKSSSNLLESHIQRLHIFKGMAKKSISGIYREVSISGECFI